MSEASIRELHQARDLVDRFMNYLADKPVDMQIRMCRSEAKRLRFEADRVGTDGWMGCPAMWGAASEMLTVQAAWLEYQAARA